MTKKHFIALADMIREHNKIDPQNAFCPAAIEALAQFCKGTNPNFKAMLWLDYIAGRCGPSGGKLKS